MQKIYQKLQDKNLKKAKRIYDYLKFHKSMSENTFAALYYGCSINENIYYNGSYSNLVTTTKQFLYDHGLMEFHLINNLRVYVATQKCVRTKSFANATRIAQTTTNAQIDKAIEYVKLNDNKVPSEFEGPVVANIIGLNGNVWKEFVELYNYQSTWNDKEHYGLGIKFKVLSVVTTLVHKGLLKKV